MREWLFVISDEKNLIKCFNKLEKCLFCRIIQENIFNFKMMPGVTHLFTVYFFEYFKTYSHE